jgi:glycosyltransferase involved in cell wall biosynthesis
VRVVAVIDSLVPGGAETSLAILAPHVVAAGADLHVAQLHARPGLQARLEGAGIPIHDLSQRPGRLGWTAAVRRLVGELSPDLVHTTLYEADITGRVGARLARTPVVSTLATERYGSSHLAAPHLSAVKVRAAQVVDAATARLTRRLHAVSTPVADAMARHLRYDRGRIDVVGRAREPVVVPDEEGRRRLRVSLGAGAGPVVLAVARQDHVKGLDVLVAAVGELRREGRDVELWIAGREGDATSELRARAERDGMAGALRLLGHRDDVPDLLGAADVFVLPSRREGAPGALLEAMAARSAIVATDIPGVREVADGEVASLVPVDRPGEMAAAIAAVLDDPVESARKAAVALARFRSLHSPTVIAAEMIAFYERALGTSGGGG